MAYGTAPESIRYIVAGMLSTIDYVPAQSHPEEMLGLADKIIHHINIASGMVPYDSPEGPFEIRESPATGQPTGKSTRLETR